MPTDLITEEVTTLITIGGTIQSPKRAMLSLKIRLMETTHARKIGSLVGGLSDPSILKILIQKRVHLSSRK